MGHGNRNQQLKMKSGLTAFLLRGKDLPKEFAAIIRLFQAAKQHSYKLRGDAIKQGRWKAHRPGFVLF